MNRREHTTAERLAGLREAITAANGDWQEATKLWSVCADLDWLLGMAEGAEQSSQGRKAKGRGVSG